ncbi:MAG TPA: potassium channel family protein [Ktedonobacteraceae bacterium]|nr:potassium channel family protein [Ktedonobacteraceae bacterium]
MDPGETREDPSPSQQTEQKGLRARLRSAESYGLVFLAILLSLGFTAAGDNTLWSRLLTLFFSGSALLLALWTSHVRRNILLLALGVLVIGLFLALLQGLLAWQQWIWLPEALNLLLIVLTPIAMVQRLLTKQRINGQTILGALCIYLLLGLFFADLYSILNVLTPMSIFLEHPKATLSDYLYFSFITLTTTGYGDLAPQSGTARALAVIEALSGQLYLVTIVALLVGHFGKAHVRQRKEE